MNVMLTARTQSLIKFDDRYLNPEEYLAWCARVSSPDNRLNAETAPKLLNYLMEHKHWSPNEMINFSFQIKTSRAIAQQIIRHRSFSFQEFSQRYAEVNELEPVELRKKADTNRQSSSEIYEDNAIKGEILNGRVAMHMEKSKQLYDELVAAGIATESARMVLPLTTQTTIVMNGTLRSWIHFLEQRCDEHAQKEIRLIAFEIRKLLSEECPWTAKALGWSK